MGVAFETFGVTLDPFGVAPEALGVALEVLALLYSEAWNIECGAAPTTIVSIQYAYVSKF